MKCEAKNQENTQKTEENKGNGEQKNEMKEKQNTVEKDKQE